MLNVLPVDTIVQYITKRAPESIAPTPVFPEERRGCAHPRDDGGKFTVKMSKVRLDVLLLRKSLVSNIEEARGLIMAGKVRVKDRVMDKPGHQMRDDEEVVLAERRRYVGRGGVKLEHALSEFGISVKEKTALDVGASTGGFTDCLLQRGVERVYALDVGRGQLDYNLRTDARVTVMENINAHYPFDMPQQVDLVTVDVAFISLEKVVPNVLEHLGADGLVVALVKPQFEARREQVERGGLVRDPSVHANVLGRFAVWAIGQDLRFRGLIPSPILGAKGNREFFVLLRKA